VALVLIHFLIFGLIALATIRGSNTSIVWYASLSLIPGSIRLHSVFTYSFLHEDVFHLSSNMLFLWVFGGSVEDAIGWKRFLLLFFAAAALAGLMQAGMVLVAGGQARTIPIVGASGAISAIVGAFAVRFYRSRIRFVGLPFRIPAVILVTLVLLAEMGIALFQLTHRSQAFESQTAAHWAHIGGFILGVFWAQATRMMKAGRREYLATDAAIEMERGSPLAAAHRWEAVLQEEPENLHAMGELARAWGLVGDREQSAGRYREIISGLLRKFFPDELLDNPADQFAAAAALEEAGEYEASLGAFDLIPSMFPESREVEMAQLRSAVLLVKRLSRAEDGRERLRAFLEEYPATEWRAYAEDVIRAAP